MVTENGRLEADRRGSSGPGSYHLEFSGAGVTLGSAGLYDLDTNYISDVLGLRARRPEEAVVKVMSRKDNQSVRVLIPDENVGYQGFHDVPLHDMADADMPYVAVSDLSALRQEWPALVVSRMTWHQLELEQMRHDFIECFTTTFLRAHSWLNWVDEDDDEHDEVGLKDKARRH